MCSLFYFLQDIEWPKHYPNKILMESWRFNRKDFVLGRVEIKLFKVEHLGGRFQSKHQKAEENKFLV